MLWKDFRQDTLIIFIADLWQIKKNLTQIVLFFLI